MEAAKQLVPIIVQGSMFLMIMAIAMQSRWGEVLEHIRRPTLLLRGIVAVNVMVPLVAALLVLALPLDRPIAIGLILMAVSPLAPLMPGNALKAGAQRSVVISLYILLIILAILIVPLTVSILNAVFGGHAVAPLPLIAKVVVMTALIPIALGLLMSVWLPSFAQRAAPIVTLVANVCLGLFAVLFLWVAGRQFLAMIGNGTIFAFTVTAGAGVLAGHLLGGRDPANRSALALAAAIRHPGIAAAIGHASGADKQALTATILFLLNGVVVTAIYRAWLKRHVAATAVPA